MALCSLIAGVIRRLVDLFQIDSKKLIQTFLGLLKHFKEVQMWSTMINLKWFSIIIKAISFDINVSKIKNVNIGS